MPIQNNHQKSKMEMELLPLEALPALVLLDIAKHLPTDDARNLSLTCKRIRNILPNYPQPLIIRGYNFEERQCEGILGQQWDGYFRPKRYFQSPLLESKVDHIEMTMKWKDQVLDHCCHEEVHSVLKLRKKCNLGKPHYLPQKAKINVF